MPSQNRKASEHVCECFEAHETKGECENHNFYEDREASVGKHRAITAQVILYSKTVEVLVGKEQKETFVVHKDLLTLHSGYFSNLLGNKGPGEDMKIYSLQKSIIFVHFVSWIYIGEFLKVPNDALEAPAFQNFCMNGCRTYCKRSETDPKSIWPFINGIKLMYSITPQGSSLRKLAVESLTYKNPLHTNKKGSATWKERKTLLTGQNSKEAWIKDLREDFALEAGKDWKKMAPWDDRRRGDYMEEEVPLYERWEQQILAARSREDIERAALAKTDVRSIIEWAHLQRSEGPEEDGSVSTS